MSQKLSIHAGAVAPYQLELVIGSAPGGFDLTLVSAGEFELLRSNARNEKPYETWAATVSSALSTDDGGTSLTLTHIYQAGDVPDPGTIYLRAKLTHPSGPIYSRPLPLTVKTAL